MQVANPAALTIFPNMKKLKYEVSTLVAVTHNNLAKIEAIQDKLADMRKSATARIGAELKKLRKAKKIKQSSLARDIGIFASDLSWLENGHKMTHSTAVKLEKWLSKQAE